MTAVKAKNKREFQSIIVSSDRDQNGKVTQTIVAFRNGKQLNKEQAQKLYQKLKTQYQDQRRAFRQQQRSMQQMENSFFRNEQSLMNQFFQLPRPPFGVRPQAENPWTE